MKLRKRFISYFPECVLRKFLWEWSGFHFPKDEFVSLSSSNSDSRMDPKRLDGKVLAEEIQNELVAQVSELKEKGCTPGLAVVLVGERKDSQTYVKMKKQLAEKVGMNFVLKDISASVTQEELLNIVQDLNEDKTIHGLIVQLPLPEQINEKEILDAVSYEKDIDGFHPLNIGNSSLPRR